MRACTWGAPPTWRPRRRRGPPARRTSRAGALSVGPQVPPVPGFVDDAVRIAARIAHREAGRAGVALQPVECRRGLGRFLRRRLARGTDVERVARTVFAEARRRVYLQG